MSDEQWQEGNISDTEALRRLCDEYAEVEAEYRLTESRREALRNYISVIVGKLGNKAEIGGFGRLEITDPSVTASYETAKLDKLCFALIQDGYGEIAEQIARCRKQTMRSGGLRITREKQ